MNMPQRVPGLQVVCWVTRPSYTFRQCDRVLRCPAGDFAFDRVLGADERQLFVIVGLQAVGELLEGRSTLVCACDQAKSFSLLGSSAQPGLIWRVVKELEDLPVWCLTEGQVQRCWKCRCGVVRKHCKVWKGHSGLMDTAYYY